MHSNLKHNTPFSSTTYLFENLKDERGTTFLKILVCGTIYIDSCRILLPTLKCVFGE